MRSPGKRPEEKRSSGRLMRRAGRLRCSTPQRSYRVCGAAAPNRAPRRSAQVEGESLKTRRLKRLLKRAGRPPQPGAETDGTAAALACKHATEAGGQRRAGGRDKGTQCHTAHPNAAVESAATWHMLLHHVRRRTSELSAAWQPCICSHSATLQKIAQASPAMCSVARTRPAAIATPPAPNGAPRSTGPSPGTAEAPAARNAWARNAQTAEGKRRRG